ncbi:MAG: hypothetical protein KAR35_00125 [Candidatus Heimdallarchaeota archaeon]|nr:hypothetical protein [Candidatus Heimdallarchaeota archaeon]MCK5047756.1 hypothetical protein [Candidatus Heimdallarchaeota archaeon]
MKAENENDDCDDSSSGAKIGRLRQLRDLYNQRANISETEIDHLEKEMKLIIESIDQEREKLEDLNLIISHMRQERRKIILEIDANPKKSIKNQSLLSLRMDALREQISHIEWKMQTQPELSIKQEKIYLTSLEDIYDEIHRLSENRNKIIHQSDLEKKVNEITHPISENVSKALLIWEDLEYMIDEYGKIQEKLEKTRKAAQTSQEKSNQLHNLFLKSLEKIKDVESEL